MEFFYKLAVRIEILLKELINEIVWRSKNPKDLTILCFIVSSIVFVITYTHPVAQGDDVLYFLSSISQGLAAIFSLIFVITVFGAQMAKSYTSFDKIVDKWTIRLMIMFSIGIILPLVQLIANYSFLPFDKVANLNLSINLFLATFCVSSIVPYSIRVNRIMKYEGGIANLIADASEAIDSDHKITASNSMGELIKIGKDSINDRQWDKIYIVVEKIELLGKETVDKQWIDFVLSTTNGLNEICNESYNKGRHTNIYFIIYFYFLQPIFNKKLKFSVQYEYIKVIIRAINALGKIGLESIDKKLDGVPLYFGRSLQNNLITTHFIDFDREFSHLDYDSACYYLDIDNVKPSFHRIIDFFSLWSFQTEFLKASLYTELGDYGKFWGNESFNIIGINKKMTDERYLKKFEHYGIERFSSLPQEIMMKLLEIGTEASTKSRYPQEFAIASATISEAANIGIKAIHENLSDGTVSMSSYCIYMIGLVSIKESLDFVDVKDTRNRVNELRKGFILLPYAVELLENIANEAYNIDKDMYKNSYESSLSFLWILGIYASKYLPNYAKEMASDLKKSNSIVMKDKFGSEYIREEIREYFKNSDLIEELKVFERLYDQ